VEAKAYKDHLEVEMGKNQELNRRYVELELENKSLKQDNHALNLQLKVKEGFDKKFGYHHNQDHEKLEHEKYRIMTSFQN